MRPVKAPGFGICQAPGPLGVGSPDLGTDVVGRDAPRYSVSMTGTRWFPVEDYGSEDHRVRLRDALWGGLATLRDPDGTLRDPLIFKSREDAFRWLRECAKVWDSGAVLSPPRFASICTNCGVKTGRPVVFEDGFSPSGPGTATKAYCTLCAAVRLSPPSLMLLKRAHESLCARCRNTRPCHEREPIVDAYNAAMAFASARNLER